MAVNLGREIAVEVAFLAVKKSRYDAVLEAMQSVATLTNVDFLSKKERNMLELGYLNVMASELGYWNALSSFEQKEVSKGNEVKADQIKEYIRKVERKIEIACINTKNILEEHLLPLSYSLEDIVFCRRMLGDSYRYRAMLKTGEERAELAQQAFRAYSRGDMIAEMLPVADPIRLGLTLNFSVLFYDIYNSPEGDSL